MAPREVVLGLDSLERGVSLFGAGVAFVLALVTGIEWIRNTPVTTTIKYVKGKVCPAAYSMHVGLFCEHVARETRGYWGIRTAFVLVVGLCILIFALRHSRAAVICFTLFLGLGLGLEAGLVFLFLGVWLMVRAWRLQRYGVPTMLGANRVAREMGLARRESKSRATPSKAPDPKDAKPAAPPPASKRYTPKKPARKRR